MLLFILRPIMANKAILINTTKQSVFSAVANFHFDSEGLLNGDHVCQLVSAVLAMSLKLV